MAAMILCTSCERHVRENESHCPFCASELHVGDGGERAAVPAGASRAQRYAARAAIIASTAAVACGGNANKDDTTADKTVQQDGQGGAQADVTPPPPPDPDDVRNQPPMPYGCVWPDEPDEPVTV